MIRGLLSGGDILSSVISILLSLPTILIALTFHEYAHGYVAYKLGDPTPKAFGRLSLNPIKHLDPIGALCMLVAGFGWARPVPINTRYFKKPKRDMALTAFAGPAMNIILSFIGLFCSRLVVALLNVTTLSNDFKGNLVYALFLFCYGFHTLNLGLAVFNLIPVPPLDGSRLAFVLLPDKLYFGVMKYERTIQIVVMIAVFAGLLDLPMNYVMGFISSGMNKILNLVPGL